MKKSFLHRLGRPAANQSGYVLLIVTMMGLVLAVIFGHILPQLHMGQEVRALTKLNETRAYEAARRGVEAVRLGIMSLGTSDDLRHLVGMETDRGIAWAIEEVCGTQATPIHDEYTDADGNIQFVSTCRGTDLDDTEDGELKVVVFVSRGGASDDPDAQGSDTNRFNDHRYFYNDGETGTDGPLLSIDNTGSITWTSFEGIVTAASIDYHFCDLDLSGTINDATDRKNLDIRFRLDTGTWYFALGSNGLWRGRESNDYSLFNLKNSYTSGDRPFQVDTFDNDDDGITDAAGGCEGAAGGDQTECETNGGTWHDDDPDDTVEVFIIVRAKGKTAAPGSNYATDKTDLVLISEAPGSHLPDPLPQVLEAGFYLTGDSSGNLEVHRFYFSQAHNLE